MIMFIIKSCMRVIPKLVLAVSIVVGNPLVVHAQEPIKIGLVGGISGACGPLVDSEVKALELGVEELNDAGGIDGREIVMIKRDSKTKPDEGAKQARDLVLNENVDVLTGTCSSAVLLAISAVANELSVPYYTTIGSTQRANIEFYHPYIFQTQANAMMEAKAAAVYAAGQEDWKKVATIGFDYEWGHTSSDTFVEELKRLRPEIELVDQLWPKIGEGNMTSYITALLSKKPDVVYGAVFGGGLTSLIKQGTSYGMFQQTNLLTLTTVDFLKTMGSAMPEEGIHGFARAPFFALDNPQAAEFVGKYRDAYGEYPDDWAVLGYDGLMLYAKLVEAAGGTDSDAVMAALQDISYEGLRGTIKFRALDNQALAPVYMGPVGPSSEYPFPVIHDVTIVDGETTIPSVELVEQLRAQHAEND